MAAESGMRALCFHYATTLLHSYILKLTIQLLKQNSSSQSTVISSQGGLPSNYSVLPNVPPLPSNSSRRSVRFSSSASLHQHSRDAVLRSICRRPSDRRQCRRADSMAFLTIISQSCLQRYSGSLLAPQEPNSDDANDY